MFSPRLREAHAILSSCMMLIRILILMLVQDPHVQCPGVVRKSVFFPAGSCFSISLVGSCMRLPPAVTLGPEGDVPGQD